jgi:hypothetical protein
VGGEPYFLLKEAVNRGFFFIIHTKILRFIRIQCERLQILGYGGNDGTNRRSISAQVCVQANPQINSIIMWEVK